MGCRQHKGCRLGGQRYRAKCICVSPRRPRAIPASRLLRPCMASCLHRLFPLYEVEFVEVLKGGKLAHQVDALTVRGRGCLFSRPCASKTVAKRRVQCSCYSWCSTSTLYRVKHCTNNSCGCLFCKAAQRKTVREQPCLALQDARQQLPKSITSCCLRAGQVR